MPLLVTTCPHCLTERVSFTSCAVLAKGDRHCTALFVCPVCHKPVGGWFRKRSSGQDFTEIKQSPHLFSASGWQCEGFWPNRPAPSTPADVPSSVAGNFVQVEEAARRGHRDAAGMAYGRALELGLKEKYAELEGSLHRRIEELAASCYLTKDVAEWAHSVRQIRNDATHDDEEPSEEHIAELGAFTKVVLEYIYTMPEKVRRRSGESSSGQDSSSGTS